LRRAIIALVSTAAGTVLLVGFKAGLGQTANPGTVPVAGEGQQPSKSAPPPSGAAPKTTGPAGAKSAAPGTGTSTKAANTLRNGTFKGSLIETDYGPVELSIVVAGGKITDVKVLKAPTEHTRSQQINTTALPKLRQEALAAQSANIDSVSGASSTSDGYRRSLQSAIDQARGG
jgi:uncharacterized protein with FMN-binding domain